MFWTLNSLYKTTKVQWKPVPNDCTVHENLPLNVEATFTYHQLQHWGPSWTLERKREEKKHNKYHLYSETGSLHGSWRSSFFICRLFVPLSLLSPSGTASNSVSSWGKVASSGSWDRICSTRACRRVNVLSLPLSRGSCKRTTHCYPPLKRK